MDRRKSIVDYLSEIPDNRRGAGQRHEQTFILLVVLMGTMSGCYGYRAMGDFIRRNKSSLIETLHPKKDRVPSFDTVRRVLMGIDFSMLSKQFSRWAQQYVTISGDEWVSIDGKAIGGTTVNKHSSSQSFINLVSLYSFF